MLERTLTLNLSSGQLFLVITFSSALDALRTRTAHSASEFPTGSVELLIQTTKNDFPENSQFKLKPKLPNPSDGFNCCPVHLIVLVSH